MTWDISHFIYAAPVIRRETLDLYPEIGEALAPLANLLDEEKMGSLNFQVDQEKRRYEEVVQEFLKKEVLTPSCTDN